MLQGHQLLNAIFEKFIFQLQIVAKYPWHQDILICDAFGAASYIKDAKDFTIDREIVKGNWRK